MRRRSAGRWKSRVVMMGDQLETNVAGALAAGIDVALLKGVSEWTDTTSGIAASFLLATIEP